MLSRFHLPMGLRVVQRSRVLAILLLGAFLLSACVQEQPLPPEARLALEEQLASLPGAAAGFEIGRTWRGRNPRSETPPWARTLVVLCAEVEFGAAADGQESQQPVIWIVIRYDEHSPWTAAMLMTMSATWPYEACSMPYNW